MQIGRDRSGNFSIPPSPSTPPSLVETAYKSGRKISVIDSWLDIRPGKIDDVGSFGSWVSRNLVFSILFLSA